MRAVAMMFLLAAVGCAAPDIATCVRGAAWADCCGSSGAPRFACQGGGDCLWFAHGCVAAGYVESACPSDNLCCVAEGGGRTSPGIAGADAFAFTLGWGTGAWDAGRSTIPVVLGATSSAPRPFVQCSSIGSSGVGVCSPGAPQLVRLPSLHGALVLRLHDGRYAFHETEISVELIPNGAGAWVGRVCSVPTTDVSGPSSCATSAPGQACAVSGTITIGGFPSSEAAARTTPIDVEALMPDGSPMLLRL